MSNNYFSFRQFTIYQDQCAMKVGTDGVLLGAWTDIEDASRILDVGTGTGLIAIMLAQRSSAYIDAIEIEESAFLQAGENAKRSPWHGRINTVHDSVQHFSNTTSSRYEVIVSNPPYFQNSLQPPAKARTIAKHNVGLDYAGLLACSSKLLLPGGRLSVIIPSVDHVNFVGLADFHRLTPSRITWIRPLPGKDYTRCLMELSALTGIGCIENELIIRKDDPKKYSEEYIELTRDFYLGF